MASVLLLCARCRGRRWVAGLIATYPRRVQFATSTVGQARALVYSNATSRARSRAEEHAMVVPAGAYKSPANSAPGRSALSMAYDIVVWLKDRCVSPLRWHKYSKNELIAN